MSILPHQNDEYNPQLTREPDEFCLATWWQQKTPGTSYWRCLVPARHLPGQVLPFTESDLALDPNGIPIMPRKRGVNIWQFLGDEARSQVALEMARIHGERVLMELDDNYLVCAPYLKNLPGRPWVDTIEQARENMRKGFGSLYSHERHRLITPRFDGLIVATEYLADKYYKYNENIYVCPNSIDPDDWQYEREPHDEIFRIVYYGSYSHLRDTPLITKAMKWAAKQPGVEIWVAGFEPKDWSFPHQLIPWTYDLVAARQNLFKFDLGVAPVVSNPWANAKSDLKGMEYAMAGVMPLMSDMISYVDFKKHDADLVVKDGDWMEAIKHYVQNPDIVKEKAAAAKQWVLDNRTIDKTIHLWREAISGS